MHRTDPQVRFPPTEPYGLGIFWANLSNGRSRGETAAGGGQNFAVGAMVNRPGAANALKTFAPRKAAMRTLRLSRHTPPMKRKGRLMR
jgi:hypothetical protein